MRLVSVIAAAILGLCVLAVILGQFGNTWWMLDLFSHFVPQYLVAATVCGLVFALRRSHFGFFVSLMLWLVCFSQIYPYLAIQAREERHEQNPNLVRVMFYNMYVGNTHYEEIAKSVQHEDPDIVVFEEVEGVTYRRLREALGRVYGYSGFRDGPNDYFDIAYFAKIPPQKSKVHYLSGYELPTLDLEFTQHGEPFRVIGVHTSAPTSKERQEARNDHLIAIAKLLHTSEGRVIVGGDFNISPWSPFWKDFLSRSGLVEARLHNGLSLSWPSWVPSGLGIPIDHVLLSGDLEAEGVKTGASAYSDHMPVIADISIR